MKTTLCDICARPVVGGGCTHYRLIMPRLYRFENVFPDGFVKQKIDLCADCIEKMTDYVVTERRLVNDAISSYLRTGGK